MTPLNNTYSTRKSRLQHYLLNWILISRYQMVQYGIPKEMTVRSLSMLEYVLKKIRIIKT